MQEQIITIFCLCDDLLTALGQREDPQVKMNDAEVMTVALTAAFFLHGNFETSRCFLSEEGYIPNMLSKSRLNRRIHAIDPTVWLALFNRLTQAFKQDNAEGEYILDSFPVAVCLNIRVSRSRIYQEEDFRGYIASQRQYFYGLRVHLLVTHSGQPVEFILAPGGQNDCRLMKQFDLDLEPGSTIYADKAYNDYGFEDLLAGQGIKLAPLRKKNSKRSVARYTEYLRQYMRKRIETTFSQISAKFPKSIHAVTASGFELKIALFVIAFAVNCL